MSTPTTHTAPTAHLAGTAGDTPARQRRHDPLGIPGCWSTTPVVHVDERGFFVSTFVAQEHEQATGRPLFTVAQVSFSSSAAGVLRGVHYTRTPPGCEKYVYCSAGEVLDVVVDLRVGSPTFGEVDSIRLSGVDGRAVYLPAGVGHAFVALTPDSRMTYLLSKCYRAEDELAVSAADPRLGLLQRVAAAGVNTPTVSPRDAQAPSLAESLAAGRLPRFDLHDPALEDL